MEEDRTSRTNAEKYKKVYPNTTNRKTSRKCDTIIN